jgi:hypothetical protein
MTINGKPVTANDILEMAFRAAMNPNPAPQPMIREREPEHECGSWQCQFCGLHAGTWWSVRPDPDKAPRCCRGERMLPYVIPRKKETKQLWKQL